MRQAFEPGELDEQELLRAGEVLLQQAVPDEGAARVGKNVFLLREAGGMQPFDGNVYRL